MRDVAVPRGSGERTLPVLEAAHIKPYPLVMRYEVSNGLLLRADLHKLFDGGYLTVAPQEWRIVVSKRIREESENGRDCYKLESQADLPPPGGLDFAGICLDG